MLELVAIAAANIVDSQTRKKTVRALELESSRKKGNANRKKNATVTFMYHDNLFV